MTAERTCTAPVMARSGLWAYEPCGLPSVPTGVCATCGHGTGSHYFGSTRCDECPRHACTGYVEQRRCAANHEEANDA